MKIKLDREKCIGCMACQSICPEVFMMKDEKAILKKSDSNVKCVKEAENICPVHAINVS